MVKFNGSSQKYGSQGKELHKRIPQMINMSTKDKSLYMLDSNNRLLILSFKSGGDAVLDIFNSS